MAQLESNIQKLQVLLAALSEDHLGKEDFAKSFEQVLKLLLAMEKRNNEAIAKLQREYAQMINNMQTMHSQSYTDLKGQVNDLFVGNRLDQINSENKANFDKFQQIVNKTVGQKLSEVNNRMAKIKDGYSPIKGKDYFDGKDGTELTSEQLLEKFKDKLNIDSIKDLRKTLNKMAGSKSGKLGMRKIPVIQALDLTNSVNGSATTFTVPKDTTRVLAVWSTQFPITFNASTDFSLMGTTLTLNVPVIQAGQTLNCLIETLFYA